MKKLIVAACLALVTFGAITAHAGSFPKATSLKWKLSRAAVAGGVVLQDTVSLVENNATSAPIDTSDAFNAITYGLDWYEPGKGVLTTAYNPAKLVIYTGTAVVSSDTLFVAHDYAPTSSGPWSAGSFVNGLKVTTQMYEIPLSADADAQGSPYLFPYHRFRVKGGQAAASYATGLKLMMLYGKVAPYVNP